MNQPPLAFFITFSTYGTWLHGTEKEAGSVDRKHNVYGEPFLSPDSSRERAAAGRMAEPTYVLHEAARTVVRDAIVAICEEKDWHLSALHVRSNHVHVVVSADREPGRLMSDLKARASRELNRLQIDCQERRWTRHGSTRYLFNAASVAAAVAYTLDGQGEQMAVHDSRQRAAQRAAHEVSGDPVHHSLTSCAAPSNSPSDPVQPEISGLRVHETHGEYDANGE